MVLHANDESANSYPRTCKIECGFGNLKAEAYIKPVYDLGSAISGINNDTKDVCLYKTWHSCFIF